MDPSDLRAGVAQRLSAEAPIDAETFNAACFMLSRSLDGMPFTVLEAPALVRRLLRVAGRVVIDTGTESGSPDVWPNTKEMAVQWIDEALAGLGYTIRSLEGGKQPDDV
jgi:hypothetical protein